MKNLLITLTATGLLAIGSTAAATTIEFGDIAGDYITGGSLLAPANDVIDDQWIFTLLEPLLTAISLDSNDNLPFFEISDFVASSSSPDIVFDYDAGDNAYLFSGLLAAGTYTIDVTGLVTGEIAGQYDILLGMSAVPVPAAAWLFGSALLGLMASGRRTLKV